MTLQSLLTILLLVPAIFYSIGLWWLRRGLHRLPQGNNRENHTVSVLIAARNEATNIESCLRAVAAQSYPAGEIIVIDDHSTDSTAKIVRLLQADLPQLRLLHSEGSHSPRMAPKKAAIHRGILQARGDIIVTTDADCRPPASWLHCIVSYFEPGVGMVAGFNPYILSNQRAGVLSCSLALDYFAMAAVAAAAAGLGYPVSCSGGNLAYRRELYFELNGQNGLEHWISGDDDLFLGKVRDRSRYEIRYTPAKEAQVPTQPPGDAGSFIQQRLRYASKATRYSAKMVTALCGVYLLNVLLTVAPLFALIGFEIFDCWIVAFALKSFSEYGFLRAARKPFSFNFRLRDYILTAFWHPVYVTVIGLLAQVLKFEWKGRKHKKKIPMPRIYTARPLAATKNIRPRIRTD